MDVHVHALGGQWNQRQLGELAVAFAGRGLGLLLGFFGRLGHTNHCLFFLVAGGQSERQSQSKSHPSATAQASDHDVKDTKPRV